MTNNIHVLSRAVVIDDEHILLAYDPRVKPFHYYELNKKFYYLPGGHIEFKESAERSVIREIEEETGYKSTIEYFLGCLEHAWHFTGDEICCHTHEINLIFKVNIPRLKAGTHIIQREEHVAFDWININNLQEIDLRPEPLKKLIPGWLNAQATKSFQSTIKNING
jgi:8-oxo-dGTP pyrophosphatase MutT (NUDIX family)